MAESLPLEIRNLSVKFNKPLFEGVNLVVHRKQFITLMGENGSGKTTLLDCIMGCLKPQSGEILFWGRKHQGADRRVINSKVGWVVSQKENYPPLMTVEKLLSEVAKIYPSWNKQLCDKLLESFQLDRTKKLMSLSMGENSKVRLIKAISFEPQLLVLDELTANLSPDSKKSMIDTLIDLFASLELSVLYVCHSKEEAVHLSDEIYILRPDGLKKK
jgi:ABC-2 type transport system ATP-binding protein